jgi:hypothetical protein
MGVDAVEVLGDLAAALVVEAAVQAVDDRGRLPIAAQRSPTRPASPAALASFTRRIAPS